MKIAIRSSASGAASPLLRALLLGTLVVVIAASGLGCPGVKNCYVQTNLVSDTPLLASSTDADLVNGWGVAFSPTSFAWVANNGTHTSTVYDGLGAVQSLRVNIPAATLSGPSRPTGIVANTTASFVIADGIYSTPAPALFLFASEDGGISGWNPTVNADNAILAAFDATDSPQYTGLAIGSNDEGDFLFAADFANGEVDVFDGDFLPVPTAAAFVDTLIPSDYAPFGIACFDELVYVSYAQQDETGVDVVDGEGKGYISVFSMDGALMQRFVQNTGLNAPWGMAIAPANFGRFSGKLLVSNYGDGTISAYKTATGAYRGQMRTESNGLLTIDGLRGIAFGNGAHDQPTSTLYFAAGPSDEANGLFGSIEVCP
ncbi:MAG: TIGR03118 family protein [FCB group bacterium]|nr:TIGR03118 family protein [FCB group bacterium]